MDLDINYLAMDLDINYLAINYMVFLGKSWQMLQHTSIVTNL